MPNHTIDNNTNHNNNDDDDNNNYYNYYNYNYNYTHISISRHKVLTSEAVNNKIIELHIISAALEVMKSLFFCCFVYVTQLWALHTVRKR